jgi:type VI secretion system secreted protein VgrG
MRSRAVTMRDYDWSRSLSRLEATWTEQEGDADVDGHFEFPADDERNRKEPGSFPAQIRLERFGVEAMLREGSSSVRALEPGRQFRMHDDDGQHEDVDLLVVRVETFATERAPEGTVLDDEPFGFARSSGPLRPGYENRFQVLPVAKQFRPAIRTPTRLIHGVQTARVTAEEHPEAGRPEINVDPHGCVRVRFPWDQRDDSDPTPSSAWIRVSQHWAGPGFGALYNPRVGHEVLVAYLQGDPERPVIVGRVYNEPNRPPYDASQYPTRSTLKSQTAIPVGEGFNELRFEDAATLEEIFLHAQRDLNEVVRANHSTSVGGDQSSSVTGKRSHSVKGTETVTVTGDRTTTFESNENHTVYSQRMTTIGTDDLLGVFGNQETKVSVNRSTDIGAEDELKIGASRKVTIGANQEAQANGHFLFKAMNGYWTLSSDFQVSSTTAGFYQKAQHVVNVMGAVISVTPGTIELTVGGARITMSGGRIHLNNGAGSFIDLSGGNITMKAGGSVFARSGGTTTVSAGGDMFLVGSNINATGGVIKLNG